MSTNIGDRNPLSPEAKMHWQKPPPPVWNLSTVLAASNDGSVIEGDFPLPQDVIDHLPTGTTVRSCYRLITESEWTVFAKVEATLANGDSSTYLLKCAEHEQGRAMLEGEFTSMEEIRKIRPKLVPKMYGRGEIAATTPSIHYLLCDFVEMRKEDPDPASLCQELVALHKTSKSPNGMFGFHLNPLRGNLPLQASWEADWAEFFTQLFHNSLSLDQSLNGTWRDLAFVVTWATKHVVPKVLGPLALEGRVIKPSLIHGDLWDGNIGTQATSGNIVIFDASSYYAHHEMDIAIWRSLPDSAVGSGPYVKEYLSQMGISEPADQFDDRHDLYSACTALHAAACHDRASAREETYSKLKRLCAKYAPLPTDCDRQEDVASKHIGPELASSI